MARVLGTVRVGVADERRLPVVVKEVVGQTNIVGTMGNVEKTIIVILGMQVRYCLGRDSRSNRHTLSWSRSEDRSQWSIQTLEAAWIPMASPAAARTFFMVRLRMMTFLTLMTLRPTPERTII